MLKATRLPGPFGVEVTGLDVSQVNDEGVVKQLVDLLYEHRILVIRDQKLSPADYVRFGHHWGDPIDFFLPTHRDSEHLEMIQIGRAHV